MPNTYVLNQKPTTYGQALSLLVEMLVGAGWTYQSSGDGLAGFSSNSKIFTNFVSGAALSWSNSAAWARIQDPSGIREFVFQHDNAQNVRFKYSPNAKFTGGSPSATLVPSATDEQIFRGSGTDASPTYSGWFSTGIVATPPTAIHVGAALSAAPYGFWFASQVQGGGGSRFSSLMFDPVQSVPEDTDPYVIHIAGGNGYLLNASSLGRDAGVAATWTTTPVGANDGCYAFMNAARTSFLYVQPAVYVFGFTGQADAGSIVWGGINTTSGLSLNTFNGKLDVLPIAYLRVQISATATAGIKGWSSLARWAGQTKASLNDVMDNKNWIYIGQMWLPWDGVTTPIF